MDNCDLWFLVYGFAAGAGDDGTSLGAIGAAPGGIARNPLVASMTCVSTFGHGDRRKHRLANPSWLRGRRLSPDALRRASKATSQNTTENWKWHRRCATANARFSNDFPSQQRQCASPPLPRRRQPLANITRWCSISSEHNHEPRGTPRTCGVPRGSGIMPPSILCRRSIHRGSISPRQSESEIFLCTLPHPCVHERHKFVRDVHKKARSFRSGRVVFLSADRHDLRQCDRRRHRLLRRHRRRKPPPSPSAAAA